MRGLGVHAWYVNNLVFYSDLPDIADARRELSNQLTLWYGAGLISQDELVAAQKKINTGKPNKLPLWGMFRLEKK